MPEVPVLAVQTVAVLVVADQIATEVGLVYAVLPSFLVSPFQSIGRVEVLVVPHPLVVRMLAAASAAAAQQAFVLLLESSLWNCQACHFWE